MPNVLIPCGGRWVGLVLRMKRAMAEVPSLRTGRLLVADRNASNPAGFFADGLPIGIEFLGRPYSEGALLKAAYGYEQATRHRHPPASAPALAGEP